MAQTFAHDPDCNTLHDGPEPCSVAREREYAWTIEKQDEPWRDFPYHVKDAQGYFVTCAQTLWGAKRALRKEKRKRKRVKKDPVTVYREPDNPWLAAVPSKRLPGEINLARRKEQ